MHVTTSVLLTRKSYDKQKEEREGPHADCYDRDLEGRERGLRIEGYPNPPFNAVRKEEERRGKPVSLPCFIPGTTSSPLFSPDGRVISSLRSPAVFLHLVTSLQLLFSLHKSKLYTSQTGADRRLVLGVVINK